MGSQISSLLAILGYDVTAWNRGDLEMKQKKCQRARRLLGRKFEDKGGEIRYTDNLQALSPALTIEVLEEDLQTKKQVIEELPYDPSTHGLFSNTSSYRPQEIHPAAGGLHFFNPIQALRLIEHLAPPLPTEAGNKLRDLLAENDFAMVEVKENRGYIGNFLLFAEISATLKLVDEYGYTTDVIDQVTNSIGRDASIFSIIDLIGIDTTKRILDNLHEEDPSIYVSPLLDKAMAQDIYGRKNGTSILEVING
jgi:3-hydroxyacyl-CoA dehydrogenase